MTAPAAVTWSLASISAARACGFGLGVRPIPPSGEPGWGPADDLSGLGARLESVAAAAGTRRLAVAATWYLEKHAWCASGAALAGLLAHRALPPLQSALTHHASEGWVDALALPESGWQPAGALDLAEALEQHLAPLVEALRIHRPARALWRCAGDRLGQAALWCAEAFGRRDAAWSLAAEALAAPTALRGPADFGLADGIPFRRRTGCCLSHRCPGGATCDDCPLARPAR